MGASRQTAYNAKKAALAEVRRPRSSQLQEEILLLVAAKAAYGNPSLLAKDAKLEPGAVIGAMDDLASEGHLRVFRDETGSLSAEATEATYLALRFDIDRLHQRRENFFTVYLQLPDNVEKSNRIVEQAQVDDANQQIAMVPRSTAPSTMQGDELAFLSPAPSTRRALRVSADYWWGIVDAADGVERSDAPFMVADIIPPGGRPVMASAVLDALVERLYETNGRDAREIREIRARFSGLTDERTLALRCASEAGHAVSRVAGVDRPPRELRTGDDAHAEFEAIGAIASDVRVNRPSSYTDLKDPLDHAQRALALAADYTGPYPGGRLGGTPLEEIRPTPDQLELIAIASADALAAAQAGRRGRLQAVTRIVVGPTDADADG